MELLSLCEGNPSRETTYKSIDLTLRNTGLTPSRNSVVSWGERSLFSFFQNKFFLEMVTRSNHPSSSRLVRMYRP